MATYRHKAFEKTHIVTDDFPFESLLQTGDRICFGQACSEPTALLGELLRQGESLHAKLGRLTLFVAGSYSGLIKPEHAAWFDFEGYGAIGDSAALAKMGVLNVHPIPYSSLPAQLEGSLRPDVMLLQLSAPNEQGRHSLGVANDFQLSAARNARVVIAEITPSAPFSPSALLPDELRIDHVVHTDNALVEGPVAKGNEVTALIASHVAALVKNGATLQMGVGSLMDAICHALRAHQDLGIHGGILTDGMAALIKQGVVNNRCKATRVGRSVVGSLLGTRQLFDFSHNNTDIVLAETQETHGAESLAQQVKFCSINSAIEVDLTGQVNAEISGGRYIGAIGGQPDFVRAAARSQEGMSIIALPSSARGGAISRIVSRLGGPVTTARSDVDYVVTEWGVARLRGLSLKQRAHAMAQIAHPERREALLQESAS